MKVLLVGHGRMGRLVESLCAADGIETVACLDSASPRDGRAIRDGRAQGAEVAIDFSTAEAFAGNLPHLAAAGLQVVVGTTGWQCDGTRLKQVAADAGIGVVAASNFSLGVNLFLAVVERSAELFAARDQYGAWLHEAHHAGKRDAPSGTAVTLLAGLERAGYDRPVAVSSTRAGAIPGTHTLGFDGPGESIELTHTARDRTIFARGALHAARWIRGKQGWFTMHDVLGLTPTSDSGSAAAYRDETRRSA